MEYLNAAFDLSDFVFVGLTQPNIRDLQATPSASHRSLAYNNPLTYFERDELLSEALVETGYTRNQFSIVPFPIETPQLLPDFLDNGVHCFTTVYDDWNRNKIERLRAAGYEVVVLWERDVKEVQGSIIRDAISTGNDVWRTQVPPATIRAVERLDLQMRLKDLRTAMDMERESP